MTLVELARELFTVAESSGVPYMAVGALAAGTYGIPRSTKDLDLLVSASDPGAGQLMTALDSFIEFDGQSQFDTITWGRRWMGVSREPPPYKVELFELFDDPFTLAVSIQNIAVACLIFLRRAASRKQLRIATNTPLPALLALHKNLQRNHLTTF